VEEQIRHAAKMTRKEAQELASSWIDWWNRRDVEAVLAHYADDARFASPTAARVTGRGTVDGKESLRAYWLAALAQVGTLKFTLDHALWDAEGGELAIVYDRLIDGSLDRACEILHFDGSGKVTKSEALYGVAWED
jgi:ketosteroid isomerase-like protein